MAWNASGCFTATDIDALTGVIALDLGAETHYLALFDNTITPDFTVASANTAFGAGVWASGEVYGTGWATGGIALAGTTYTAATGTVTWDATDISEASTTLTNAYGCLIYANAMTTPVADQGIMAVYFGGSAYNTIAGTFAINWNASGIRYSDLTP